MHRSVVIAVCLAMSGCGGGHRHRPEPIAAAAAPMTHLVTYRDPAFAFAVDYPLTWSRARADLTPVVQDPQEILVLGTGPLPAGGPRCAHVPVGAIRAMGPRDVLLEVRMWHILGPRRTTPEPALGALGLGPTEAAECSRRGRRLLEYSGDVSQAGRRLYVRAFVGRRAPSHRKMALAAALRSLRFDRPLPWRLTTTAPDGWHAAHDVMRPAGLPSTDLEVGTFPLPHEPGRPGSGCEPAAATAAMPRDGALVYVFTDPPRALRGPPRRTPPVLGHELAQAPPPSPGECGRSQLMSWTAPDGITVHANLYIGPHADAATRRAAAAAWDGLRFRD